MEVQTTKTEEFPRQWREEGPAAKPIPRKRKRFFALALFLVLVGVFAAMLSWISPPPRPAFVPIWITEYQDRRIPFPSMAARDRTGFQKGQYFAQVAQNGGVGQESHHIRARLEQLRETDSDEIVVFLSGHARRDASGALHVLPADALPDDPNTWIPFREILEKIRDCPASHKLLVVDLMRSWIDPYLGILANDAAAAVAKELEDVPDARRLVLCACSPGQTSLNSEEMGYSVFGFYLQEGLRGYADGYGHKGHSNGVINVSELAAFTTARVDRWAQQNRGQRQTPVLYGDGRDFPVVALPYQKPRPHLQSPPARKYPEWLAIGWAARDSWWQDGSYRYAPRVFREQQTLLQLGEQYWRGFIAQNQIHENIIVRFQRSSATFAQRTEQARYTPTSLAQAEFLGLLSDKATEKTVDDALEKFFKALAKAEAESKGEAPPKIREKLTADFHAEAKGIPHVALSHAVFQRAMADTKHEKATIEILNELLRTPRNPQPEFVETLLLQQLGQWGTEVQPATWAAPLIDQVLNVVNNCEQCLVDPNVFQWLQPLLDEVQTRRHEGEMRLWARGYVALADAESILAETRTLSSGVLTQAAMIQNAYEAINEAFATLPMTTAYVKAEPPRQNAWRAAVTAAGDLYTHLQPQKSGETSLADRIALLAKKTKLLQQHLSDLSVSFSGNQVDQFIKRAEQPNANVDAYRDLNGLLSVPHPALTAKKRVEVWTAARNLAKRLHEATIQLDHDEDAARLQTAAPDDGAIENVVEEETGSALNRLRDSLSLLELAGLPASTLKELRDENDRSSVTIPELGVKLAKLWSRTFRDVYRERNSAAAQTRMSWFAPPLSTFVELDQAAPAPAIRLRLERLQQQWRWLSDWYNYLSRDYGGAGEDLIAGKMVADFYRHLANANADLAPTRPQPYVAVDKFNSINPLDAKNSSAVVNARLKRFQPEGPFSKMNVQISEDETGWLKIFPAQVSSVQPGTTNRWADQNVKIPVSLQTGAKKTPTPPKGFLFQASISNRSFHVLAPVPIKSASQDVQILISANPKKPESAVNDIRLRPGGSRQKFFVYLQNPTGDVRDVTAQIGDVQVKETLAPNSTKLLKLPAGKTPKDGEPLPELAEPLTMQLSDTKTNDVLASRIIPVAIASPREYVRVTDIEYNPGGLPPGSNKLSVTLQALPPVSGPDIPVELTLPKDRIPNLQSIGGGTFRGNIGVKPKAPPLTLFAEKLKLVPAPSNNGFVYIAVDNVPRAFIYRTSFLVSGDPVTPRGDIRPGLRLSVPRFAQAKPVFTIPVQVDNAPPGAKLAVGIGRQQPGAFQADLMQNFADAKNRRIGFAVSSDGALWFDAAIQDWSVAVDTSRIQGPRIVRAQLLDRFGNEVLTATQQIMVDGTPPNIARILELPKQVKKGIVLTVKALAADAESGIGKVAFFVGRPKDDKPPAKDALVDAKPVNGDGSTWEAKLQLPEDKIGTTAISVRATNNVGLSSFNTLELELTETDLAKTGPGRITGIVTEGRLPQVGLEVVLYDEKGKVKAKTKTKKDGSYEFADLKPGKYGVYCFKPSSRRRAAEVVTVAPNQTANVPLKLAL